MRNNFRKNQLADYIFSRSDIIINIKEDKNEKV